MGLVVVIVFVFLLFYLRWTYDRSIRNFGGVIEMSPDDKVISIDQREVKDMSEQDIDTYLRKLERGRMICVVVQHNDGTRSDWTLERGSFMQGHPFFSHGLQVSPRLGDDAI